jgi:hypothetical protein
MIQNALSRLNAVLFFLAFGLLTLAPVAIDAAERSRIGYGRLITNDTFGDRFDRWRTGSLAASRVWGPEWTGTLPSGFGDMLELRWGLDVVAPENIEAPAVGDRPFGGSISVGLHTHFATRFADVSVGGDLVFVGPSTRLDEAQDAIHDLLGVIPPSAAVKNNQIEDGVHPTLVFEAGRDLDLGERLVLRPFVEARAGFETYARAGFDLTFGDLLQGEFLVRDPVSGHRYRTIRTGGGGTAYVIGADIAYVEDSVLLPEDRGLQIERERARVRAGVHWQNDKGVGFFYGVTWLGKEFKGQRDDQVTGSVRLTYRF